MRVRVRRPRSAAPIEPLPAVLTAVLPAVLTAVLVAVAGCTGGAAGSPAPSSARPAALAGCVDVAGQDAAASGNVRAGPFEANRGRWTSRAGAKLWVGSVQAAAVPTGAVIRATRVDGTGQPLTVRRGPAERAEVATLPVFYPGLIRLPAAGQWRLDISVGADRGCFVLRT